MSIFTIPGIQLSKDPGYRSSNFPKSGVNLLSLSRRQSMLLWSMEWPSILLISLEVAMARWGTQVSTRSSLGSDSTHQPVFTVCCEVWGAIHKKPVMYKPFSKIFTLYSVEEGCQLERAITGILESKHCYSTKCVFHNVSLDVLF